MDKITFQGDLSSLVTIKDINPRVTQPYDLRYTEPDDAKKGEGRFRMSTLAEEALDIENHALILRREPKTGEILLITVPDAKTADDPRPPAEAFMQRRFYTEGSDNHEAGEPMGKGSAFKATRLYQELTENYGDDARDFALVHVGDLGSGSNAFFVRPWTEDDTENPPLMQKRAVVSDEDISDAVEAEAENMAEAESDEPVKAVDEAEETVEAEDADEAFDFDDM